MKALKIWTVWFDLWWRRELAYRLNFILRCIGMLIYNFIGPILALVIYSISKGFPGWSFEQFLIIQGIMITVLGIAHLLFTSAPWIISDFVRRGELDYILIRPIRPLFYLFCWAIRPVSVPQVVTGILITFYGAIKSNVNITNVIATVVILLTALAIIASFIIALSALTIFTVKANVLVDLFMRIIHFGEYPLTIYGPIGALLFTFLLPVGLVAYYPAQALLGQISLKTVCELVLTAGIFVWLSLMAWKLAIRKYTSAGG